MNHSARAALDLILFLLILMTASRSLIAQHEGGSTCDVLHQKVIPGVSAHYTERAVRLFPNGTWTEGAEELAESWSQLFDRGFQIREEYCTQARPDTSFIYAIEHVQTAGDGEGVMLVIYRKEGQKFLRDLEFLSWLEPGSGSIERDDQTLNDTRRKWVKLCNQHNAAELVNTMYTEDAMYYNHKPVILGRGAITEEYDYMNNPKYSLDLEPIMVKVISEQLVYEIGQCSGSYGGKYMLVWKKCSDGRWRVLMDSNI